MPLLFRTADPKAGAASETCAVVFSAKSRFQNAKSCFEAKKNRTSEEVRYVLLLHDR